MVDCLRQSRLITQLVSEKDRGIYDALNKGIELATGELIGFLHSDDLLASAHTLENIARAFARPCPVTGKMPDVVHGDLVFVEPKDTGKIVRYWKSQDFKPSLLRRGWMPPTLLFLCAGRCMKSMGCLTSG